MHRIILLTALLIGVTVAPAQADGPTACASPCGITADKSLFTNLPTFTIGVGTKTPR